MITIHPNRAELPIRGGCTVGMLDFLALSAGTGIFHSEFNKSRVNALKIVQLRLLPKTPNVKPRISRQSFTFEPNKLTEIVSPGLNGCLWLYQDAWIYLGRLETNKSLNFELKNPQKNGIYIYMLDGNVLVENTELTKGSGLGIRENPSIEISCLSNAEFLLLEIPMKNP